MKRLVAIALAFACVGCSSQVRTRHYIGVYDPQRQVTQELYRVTITGEAPWFSNFEYGTGWVSARAADLLDGRVALPADPPDANSGNAGGGERDKESTGAPKPADPPTPLAAAERKFFEVGPLGISLRPDSYRFAAVMAADPSLFFRKMGALTRFGANDETERRERERLAEQRVLRGLYEQMLEVDRALVLEQAPPRAPRN